MFAQHVVAIVLKLSEAVALATQYPEPCTPNDGIRPILLKNSLAGAASSVVTKVDLLERAQSDANW